MSSVRYHNAHDGEWYQVTLRRHLEQCCECGLVHTTDFDIRIVNGKAQLWTRSKRNERATAAARRKK